MNNILPIDTNLLVDYYSSEEAENFSNEHAFSVENAFQDDLGLQDNPDYPIESFSNAYRNILSNATLCKRCSSNFHKKKFSDLSIHLNITI